MCKKRRLEAQYCGREGQLTPGPRRKTWLDAIGIYPRHGAKERRGLFLRRRSTSSYRSTWLAASENSLEMINSRTCLSLCERSTDDSPQINTDDIDRWFVELAKSSSVLQQNELAARIAAAVSRFVMIDEDILCSSLVASVSSGHGKEWMDTSRAFFL